MLVNNRILILVALPLYFSCAGHYSVEPRRLWLKETEIICQRGNCRVCKGSGFFMCFKCRGEGEIECSRCQGTGEQICWICGGTGKIGRKRCGPCDGKGEDDCSNCDGTGEETCSRCDGAGKLICWQKVKITEKKITEEQHWP